METTTTPNLTRGQKAARTRWDREKDNSARLENDRAQAIAVALAMKEKNRYTLSLDVLNRALFHLRRSGITTVYGRKFNGPLLKMNFMGSQFFKVRRRTFLAQLLPTGQKVMSGGKATFRGKPSVVLVGTGGRTPAIPMIPAMRTTKPVMIPKNSGVSLPENAPINVPAAFAAIGLFASAGVMVYGIARWFVH